MRSRREREYTDRDRAHFAAYVEHRALYRPSECHGGLDCWVDYGPPAISRKNRTSLCCLGCAGVPQGFGKPSRATYTR
jgi:hypothetical protein